VGVLSLVIVAVAVCPWKPDLIALTD